MRKRRERPLGQGVGRGAGDGRKLRGVGATGAMMLALVGAMGAGLLIWGWRGRRVGAHPFCRKCGFDLFGSGDDAASCPECGQVLRRDGEPVARARVMGQRRRRWWAMVPGVLALVIAIGGALMSYGPSKVALYGWAPSAALVWVVEDELARDELTRRLGGGQLSDDVATRLVDYALAVQGDAARPWDEAWGAVVEQAFVAGQLSDWQLERYVQQATRLRLTVRQRVQHGRRPAGGVEHDPDWLRLGPATAWSATVHVEEIRVQGEAVPLPRWWTPGREAGRFEYEAGSMRLRRGSFLHLPLDAVGTHRGLVDVELDAGLSVELTIGPQFYAHVPQLVVLPADQVAGVSAQIEVVDEPTGVYLAEAELPVSEQATRAGVWFEEPNTARGERSRVLVVAVLDQPHRVDLECEVRIGQELVRLGWIGSSNGREADGRGHYQALRFDMSQLMRDRPGLERVDVIVRPSVDRAEAAIEPVPTWLGEWVFEGVPLDGPIEADRVSLDLYRVNVLPSLVEAKVRALTWEEATGKK